MYIVKWDIDNNSRKFRLSYVKINEINCEHMILSLISFYPHQLIAEHFLRLIEGEVCGLENGESREGDTQPFLPHAEHSYHWNDV